MLLVKGGESLKEDRLKKKLAAQKRGNARWSSHQNKPKEDSKVISETYNSSASCVMNLNDSTIIASATASERKLNEILQVSSKCVSSEVGDMKNDSYVLMQNKTWASFLSNVKCDNCETNSLDVDTERMFGYSTKLKLFCKCCGKVFSSSFSSTRGNQSNCFDINKKLVEAFLKIGKGHAALEIFSMVVGLHAMDKRTFSHCLHELSEEKEKLKDDVLEFSRNIVYSSHEELDSNDNEDVIDVAVSYDGTWHKRGHTSLYGIGIVIDILTGLVIDFEILSKYCPECICSKRDLGSDSAEFHVWFEGHKNHCSQNFYGSSNAMEMSAAEIIWKRSAQTGRIHYTTMLSDGDAKTFQHLQGLNVYDDDVTLTKEECINHVAKRLGVGLRNKVKEWRAKGVCIGGRKEGNLKEETIVKLTNFYRKAIKENINDINAMKTSIYATLLHCSSTDLSPKHSKCPSGPESWCFFQRAQCKNEKPKSHSTMKTKLSENIVSKILPVYQRLASTELLSRCAKGKTQNANESLHSLIWKNCPKETFVSKKRLEIAVVAAVGEFNFGCVNTLKMDQEAANSFSLLIAQKRDQRRLNQSRKRSSVEWKKCRNAKKFSKAVKNNAKIKKEGNTYAAGEF